MRIVLSVLLIIASYFLGNISPATILAKASGHNIKAEGSGNAGATNVLRVVGKKAAAITLIVDVLKGFIPTKLGFVVGKALSGFNSTGSDNALYYASVLAGFCGLAVFLGHVWPVLLQFKGGKGVATALGALMATNWKLGIICLIVFAAVVFATKMVSLSSLVAAMTFLLFYIMDVVLTDNITQGLKPGVNYEGSMFGLYIKAILPYLAMVIILMFKHRANIQRIIKGEENKISFKK